MDLGLNGVHVLVTGEGFLRMRSTVVIYMALGASGGIGLATTRLFLRES